METPAKQAKKLEEPKGVDSIFMSVAKEKAQAFEKKRQKEREMQQMLKMSPK